MGALQSCHVANAPRTRYDVKNSMIENNANGVLDFKMRNSTVGNDQHAGSTCVHDAEH